MKSAMTVALVTAVLALSELSLVNSASGDSISPFSVAGYTYPLNRARQRRQTSDDDTVCTAVTDTALCDSSYAQNYINEISKCGNRAGFYINTLESHCRKNSAGEYCGEKFVYVDSNCSTTSSCSAGCFNSLQQAGCCVNQGDNAYSSYLTACRIPTPSPCPKSRIRLPTLRTDSTCDTDQDEYTTLFTATCDNIDPVLRALRREKACGDHENFFSDYCSSMDGQYCLVQLNLITGTGNSLGVRALEEAVRLCPSDLECSQACNSSLNFVRCTVGCCVHAVNISSFAHYPNSSRVLSSPQWNRCGVTFPQKCGAETLKISTLLAAAAIMLCLHWI